MPPQCLNRRLFDSLVNSLVCVKMAVDCEVIPSGIYCCVTGQPPRGVGMCDEVGKLLYTRNVAANPCGTKVDLSRRLVNRVTSEHELSSLRSVKM